MDATKELSKRLPFYATFYLFLGSEADMALIPDKENSRSRRRPRHSSPIGVGDSELELSWFAASDEAHNRDTTGAALVLPLQSYLMAIASASRGCQPPPSALNAATAARADSICACARASEVCSSVWSAWSTSIRLAAPF
jgi:hypothetical protein